MHALLTPNGRATRLALVIAALAECVVALGYWHLHHGFLPPPVDVATAFGALWNPDVVAALGASLVVNAQAIAVTAAVGLGMSYAAVIPGARPLVAVIGACGFFGLVGFSFLFTLALGGGHALKVALLVFGMAPFFVRSMVDVIDAIPADEWDYARTLGMGPWRAMWEVAVLGRAADALDVLRQNAAMGWMMLTMVEGLVRSEGGIGVLLLNDNKLLRIDAVLALQALILVIGLAQDWLLGLARGFLCPWVGLKAGAT